MRAPARVGKIRWQNVDRHSGFPAQAVGESLHSSAVARYQHEIMAALGEAVGIDGANPGGGAGDQNGRFCSH